MLFAGHAKTTKEEEVWRHVHIYHDCNFHRGQCRCSFFKKIKLEWPQILPPRKATFIKQLTAEDLSNLLQYLYEGLRKGGSGDWRLQVGEAGDRIRLERNGYKDIFDARLQHFGPRYSLETCYYKSDSTSLDELQASAYCETIEGESSGGTGGEKRKRDTSTVDKTNLFTIMERKRINISNEIVRNLKRYCIVPPQNSFSHNWFTDVFPYSSADPVVKLSLERYCVELLNWDIYAFEKLYKRSDCTPLFMAGNNLNYYLSVDDTIEWVVKFLNFQFHNDAELIANFLRALWDIINKRHQKLNTMVIVSPTSSGKSWFFYMIFSYFINLGELPTLNRETFRFALADCYNRRIIHWNEPVYETPHLDTLKKLLGGDPCTTDVKFKDPITIMKTPVIVTSNDIPNFVHDQNFRDRLVTYYWDAAPMLIECHGKPNPLALPEIFKHYKIYD